MLDRKQFWHCQAENGNVQNSEGQLVLKNALDWNEECHEECSSVKIFTYMSNTPAWNGGKPVLSLAPQPS